MHSNSKTPSRRIVIVGGGVSGLSIAVRLSQSGLPVTLLESGRLGHAASTKNQGWLYSGAWYAPRQRDLAASLPPIARTDNPILPRLSRAGDVADDLCNFVSGYQAV